MGDIKKKQEDNFLKSLAKLKEQAIQEKQEKEKIQNLHNTNGNTLFPQTTENIIKTEKEKNLNKTKPIPLKTCY